MKQLQLKAMPDNPRMNAFHRHVRALQEEFPEIGFMLSTCDKRADNGVIETWTTGATNEPDKVTALWCEYKRQLDYAREQQTRSGLKFAPDALRIRELEKPTNLRLVKT